MGVTDVLGVDMQRVALKKRRLHELRLETEELEEEVRAEGKEAVSAECCCRDLHTEFQNALEEVSIMSESEAANMDLRQFLENSAAQIQAEATHFAEDAYNRRSLRLEAYSELCSATTSQERAVARTREEVEAMICMRAHAEGLYEAEEELQASEVWSARACGRCEELQRVARAARTDIDIAKRNNSARAGELKMRIEQLEQSCQQFSSGLASNATSIDRTRRSFDGIDQLQRLQEDNRKLATEVHEVRINRDKARKVVRALQSKVAREHSELAECNDELMSMSAVVRGQLEATRQVKLKMRHVENLELQKHECESAAVKVMHHHSEVDAKALSLVIARELANETVMMLETKLQNALEKLAKSDRPTTAISKALLSARLNCDKDPVLT